MYPRISASVGTALLCLPSAVCAGGFYLYEVSAAEVGLASAGWAARAQDAGTIFTNPAGMTRLSGNQFSASAIAMYADIDFDVDQSVSTIDGNNGDASAWIPLGGTYYSHSISPDLKVGVGVGGYFGSALDFNSDWAGRYYLQEITLQAYTIQPTIAYRTNPEWSVGLGLAIHYGVLKQQSAINNTPILLPGPAQDDGRLEIEDTDIAVQGNLGILWEPSASTRFGLQYLTEAKLDFSDRPELRNVRPALQAVIDLAGLSGAKLDLEVTMPQALRASFYHDMNDRLALMGNVGWEDWSRFGRVDVTLSAEDATSLTADANYKDVWHLAFGAQYKYSDTCTLSAGVAYDSEMVDDDDRTFSTPTGNTWRFGFGLEYRYEPKVSLSFAYELAYMGDLSVEANRGPLAGQVEGEFKNAMLHSFALGWRKQF
ncbi:MAG TPA: OmpP1/FadL family transporter [Burkholderiales bacterium]|nr:OmpP1/FadL family transporter [Burkholderiales bacterium]